MIESRDFAKKGSGRRSAAAFEARVVATIAQKKGSLFEVHHHAGRHLAFDASCGRVRDSKGHPASTANQALEPTRGAWPRLDGFSSARAGLHLRSTSATSAPRVAHL